MNNLDFLWGAYQVIDELPYITIADSFVFSNKIGWGHGEARLYIGQKNNSNISYEDFFDWFQRRCFFLKKDFLKFMSDAEYEYKNKEQSYIKDISLLWDRYNNEISDIKDDYLYFTIKPQNWEKDYNRFYISSREECYTLMRKISLPNISYLTILKIKNINSWEIFYYFHLFIDYAYNSQNHPHLILRIEESLQKRLENKNVSHEDRLEVERIVKSRKWQWQYRDRLLQDMNCCIVTWVNDERLLIASHIKPWAVSEDYEKIDYLNWLILTPTYDKLFDQWFITFTDSGIMLVSPYISPMNQKKMNLSNNQKFSFNVSWREKYLDFHNNNIFKK